MIRLICYIGRRIPRFFYAVAFSMLTAVLIAVFILIAVAEVSEVYNDIAQHNWHVAWFMGFVGIMFASVFCVCFAMLRELISMLRKQDGGPS